MGGLDLLPPAKGAARRGKSSSVRNGLLCVFAAALICGVLYYARDGVAHTLPDSTAAAEVEATPRVREVEAVPKAVVVSPPPPSPPPPPPAREIVSLNLSVPGGKALTLRLKLLPEYSADSVAFVKHAASHNCAGELYRSENNFLVQGRIACPGAPDLPRVKKGACPAGVAVEASRKCPSHDPQCGCHGPIMGKGMVGWAGGSAGPDLFIYTAHMDESRCEIGGCEATHWSHDHTVFAEVADQQTWDAIGELFKLPTRQQGMTFFANKIPLTVGS